MPAKKKSSRNVSKLSRNNNINPIRPKRSKRSKSALQKKKTNRGRRSRRLTRGGRDWRSKGDPNPCEQRPGERDREGFAKIKKGKTCKRNGVTGICRLAESGEPGAGSYNCLEAKSGFFTKMLKKIIPTPSLS